MLDVLAWIVSIGQLPTDPGSLYKEWQRRIALFETTFCSDLLKRPHRHPWLTLTRGTAKAPQFFLSSIVRLYSLCCAKRTDCWSYFFGFDT